MVAFRSFHLQAALPSRETGPFLTFHSSALVELVAEDAAGRERYVAAGERCELGAAIAQ